MNATAEDQSGLAAGNYSVIVKDANNCTTASLPVTITQPASAVTVALTSKTDVLCFGGTTGAINITASGGVGPYTYAWTGAGVNPTAEDQTGLAAGNYSVIVKDANNCTTASLPVTITQPASAVIITSITSNTPVCSGNTLNLTAIASGGTGALSYSWSGPNSYTSVLQNPSITNVSTTASGTYTVTVTDANGCTASTTTTVTITLRPTATISYPASAFCINNATPQTVTLTGTGAYTGGTYAASPAGLAIDVNTGTITPNTSGAGTYNVTYTTPASGGCPSVASNTFQVVITAVPTVNISYAGSLFCTSDATVKNVTISGTGNYLGGTYSVNPITGLAVNSSNGSFTPSGSTPGTYTISYTTPASGGCASVTVNTSVTITALPAITSFSYAGSPFCTSLATVQSVTLTGTGNYATGTYTASPGGLSINSSSGAINPSLSNPGTYTVTYTTTPSAGCGSVTQNITVVITALPVATFNYPGTPYCPNAANPSPSFIGGGVAGTFSSTAGLVFVSAGTGQINIATSTAGTYTVTNTIAAANGCGQVTATATVTIGDATPPVLTVPATKSIQCSASTLPANTGQATATDNCTASSTITYTDVITTGNCVNRYTITRTWKATDAAGNISTGTQTINVDDTTPPVITSGCANITVNTPNDIPAVNFGSIIATDNCGGGITISLVSENFVYAPKPGFCPTSVTRVYAATDACGNVTTCTQVITVTDISSCSLCTAAVPFIAIDLSASPTATFTTPTITRGGNCCSPGQSNCVSFNVLLNPDAVGFSILVGGASPQSKDWSIDCQPITITNGVICVTGDAFSTFTFCKTGNNANNFTFTSISGAIGTAANTVRVGCVDTLKVSNLVPASVVFTDITPGGSQGTLTPSSGSLTALFTPSASTPPVVKYKVCGTLAAATICNGGSDCDTITFNVLPKIVVTVPNLVNVCSNNIATLTPSVTPAGSYTFQWYNGPNGTGTLVSTAATYTPSTAGNYSVIATSTLSGIGCNLATTNFSVSLDLTGPTLTPPAPLQLECNNPNAAAIISQWLATATASDGANPTPAVTNNYAAFTHSCGLVKTITFTALDICGNISTGTSTITIVDVTPPNISCPAPVTVTCPSNIPGKATDYTTFVAAGGTASDLCVTPVVTWVSDVISNQTCPNNYTLTRTYKATDACGNSTTCTQVITVNNQTPPVVPANVTTTVQCPSAAVLPTPPTVNDACGTPITPTMVVGANPACEGSKTYTFTYTNCAGIFSNWVYTYVIDHTTPPVVPANGTSTVQCVANAVAPATPTVTDVCGNSLTAVLTNTSSDPVCSGTKTYTYTFTDCSGLTSTWQYVYTINSTIPPVITGTPAPVTVSCAANVPPASITSVSATGNCNSAVTITVADVITPGSCANKYSITRTWTAKDGCNNVATTSQIITVDDQVAPTWTTAANALNITLECDDASGLTTAQGQSPVATDNCVGTVTYTKTSGSFVAGTCANKGTYTNTWIAKDVCNNSSTLFTQIITINDTKAPVVTCPLAQTFCIVTGNNYTIPQLVATDNCSGIINFTYQVTGAIIRNGTGNDASGLFNLGVSTITWTATDVCGNSVTCTTTVTINPKPTPIITHN